MTDKAISGTDSRNYDRLLPCPFCGAEPEPINHGEHMFFDHDDACHFEMFKRARSVAMVPDEIAAWNTRACGQCEYGAVPMTEENMAAHGWAKVVRCRDCKWCMAYSNATYCDRFVHALPTVEPNGFCAWGERRDEQ